jgi:hypothetical protein
VPVTRLLRTLGLSVALATLVACEGSGGASGDPASPSPTVAGTERPPVPSEPAHFDSGAILREFPGGGPRNVVRLRNHEDGRSMARGQAHLHRLDRDEKVAPFNAAVAESTCRDCQTVAVALQVVLYERGATLVQPQNVAIASNVGCTRCVTVALAYQYVVPVDDPDEVPEDVRSLVREIDREMKWFASVRSIGELDVREAEARLLRLIAQHERLRQYLMALREEARDGTASPSASASAPPSPSAAAPTPSVSPSPSSSPSPSPSPSGSP